MEICNRRTGECLLQPQEPRIELQIVPFGGHVSLPVDNSRVISDFSRSPSYGGLIKREPIRGVNPIVNAHHAGVLSFSPDQPAKSRDTAIP